MEWSKYTITNTDSDWMPVAWQLDYIILRSPLFLQFRTVYGDCGILSQLVLT